MGGHAARALGDGKKYWCDVCGDTWKNQWKKRSCSVCDRMHVCTSCLKSCDDCGQKSVCKKCLEGCDRNNCTKIVCTDCQKVHKLSHEDLFLNAARNIVP